MTAVLILSVGTAAPLTPAGAADARVKLTQRDLVAECLNGRAVTSGARSWTVAAGQISFVFTMRTQPRPGRAASAPGTAAISFVAETGHRYEVEVRADAAAFSSRAWQAGAWTPVVRDRTTDAIVSGVPAWMDAATCR